MLGVADCGFKSIEMNSTILYLERGLVPINAIIKARRITYLHYLANLRSKEMLFKFFESQWKYPCKSDWTKQVKEDLEDLKMNEDLETLKNTSKNAFKRKVRIKMKEFAFKYLLDKKEKHSKMSNLFYTKLEMQNYLKSWKINVQQAKNLYRFRVRVAPFKENYKNKFQNDMWCPLCQVFPDTQAHSFQCHAVKGVVKIEGKYEEIFSSKISKEMSKTLMNISHFRENLI